MRQIIKWVKRVSFGDLVFFGTVALLALACVLIVGWQFMYVIEKNECSASCVKSNKIMVEYIDGACLCRSLKNDEFIPTKKDNK